MIAVIKYWYLISTVWPKCDIHTWIYPCISISTATLSLQTSVSRTRIVTEITIEESNMDVGWCRFTAWGLRTTTYRCTAFRPILLFYDHQQSTFIDWSCTAQAKPDLLRPGHTWPYDQIVTYVYDQLSSQIAKDRRQIMQLVVVVVDSLTIEISRKQVFEHAQKPVVAIWDRRRWHTSRSVVRLVVLTGSTNRSCW